MAKVTGVIDAYNDNFGKYNIKVNGNWYSTKPEYLKVLPEVGETVEFDDGGKKYIKYLRVVHATASAEPDVSLPVPKKNFPRGTFPLDFRDGTVSIVRQNALTNAIGYLAVTNNTLTGKPSAITTDDVIAVARKFEDYTAGFGDLKAAEAAAKKLLETEE